MSIFELTYPEGALEPDSRAKLIDDLTAVLLRAQHLPDTERFREATWSYVRELPAGSIHVAGRPAASPTFRLDTTTDAGMVSEQRREAFVAEATALVRGAAGLGEHEARVRVLMHEVASRTSLADATTSLRERMRDHLGDRLDEFDAIATELGERDFPALQVGDVAPDFTLPDARGGVLSLKELRAGGPVVLVFYRGAWCPYCNLQLKAFADALGELQAEGATLAAISPQTPDNSLSTAERADLQFAVLSDVDSRVAEQYGLVFTLEAQARELHRSVGIDLASLNGDVSWRLPAAAIFIVDPDGAVAYASVSGDYRWRVGPDEVLTELRS